MLHGQAKPNSTTAQCPYVNSVLDSLDPDTLDWLMKTYLWGYVAKYGPSSDGYTRKQNSCFTAEEKLEQLIRQTAEIRAAHLSSPAEDILSERELKVILDAWKNDTSQWRRPETWNKWWGMTNQQWHETKRGAWRSHLFHIVGCYEMAIFFVVAPFTNENLQIFRDCPNSNAKKRVRKKKTNTR